MSRLFSVLSFLILPVAPMQAQDEPIGVLKTAETQLWLDLRQLDDGQLLAVAQTRSGGSDQQTRALLTLADRNLNRSAQQTLDQIDQAEPNLVPGTDIALYASALRCQALHRQAAAQDGCDELRKSAPVAQDPVIQGFIHATRSYLLYRENRHPEALEEAYRTLEIAEQIDDPDLNAAANNAVGVHFSTRLLPRMALPHVESAWEYAGRMAYPEFKHVVRINLAAVYAYVGRNSEAVDLLTVARNSAVSTLYPTRRLVLESLLTVSLSRLGRAEEGERALSLTLDEVGESVLADARAYALTALGIAQLTMGESETALESLRAALAETGQTFEEGLSHPRVQFMIVPYAKALRLAGDLAGARDLLQSVISKIPAESPNQLLVEACSELAVALSALGDAEAALSASREAADVAAQLRDASFNYQMARLDATLERERRSDALALALEREADLKERNAHETRLRYLTYLVAALLFAVAYLWFTRRMHSRLAQTERIANERLEEQVQNRTREVEEQMTERLQMEAQSRQLAQQLTEGEKLRALGQFTAGVAHDFNNLMTVVILTAERLRDSDQLDPERRIQFADDILAAANSGAQITSSLLAYARKQPLKPTETQLDELLSDAMPMLRNTLGDRYTLNLEVESCRVVADQGQVITSVLNLLLNAREAMSGGGVVDLSLRVANEMAQITVRDSGRGMSKEACARAIDPFFTTKSVGEGTGLGLSMVYGFARQSGGDFRLESQEGVGTTAQLELPLIRDHAGARLEELNESALIRDGLKVLVVEDRDSLRKILRRTLETLGMSVTTANSADDAWQMVETDGLPELLISDIMMPGEMDGQDLAFRLRDLNSTLPIVLISGYSDFAESSITFLRKPFSIEELRTAILEALRGPPAQDLRIPNHGAVGH